MHPPGRLYQGLTQHKGHPTRNVKQRRQPNRIPEGKIILRFRLAMCQRSARWEQSIRDTPHHEQDCKAGTDRTPTMLRQKGQHRHPTATQRQDSHR